MMRDEFEEALSDNFRMGIWVGVAGILFVECIGFLAYAIIK